MLLSVLTVWLSHPGDNPAVDACARCLFEIEVILQSDYAALSGAL